MIENWLESFYQRETESDRERGQREREKREMLSKMCEKQLIVNIVEFLKRIQINEYLNTEYFSNKLSKQKTTLKR